MHRKALLPPPSDSGSSQPLEQRILAALEGLQFGAVELTVHEGKVVQIERREKFRFATPSTSKT